MIIFRKSRCLIIGLMLLASIQNTIRAAWDDNLNYSYIRAIGLVAIGLCSVRLYCKECEKVAEIKELKYQVAELSRKVDLLQNAQAADGNDARPAFVR